MTKKLECKLATENPKSDWNSKYLCQVLGHSFCNCEHCTKHPCCIRCSLYIQSGRYLA